MRKGPPPPTGLTRKQIEVLRLIGYGHCTKEIAHKMKTSEKTAHFHRLNLFRIFNVNSPIKLARIAIGFGLSTLCLMCCCAGAQPILVVSNPSPVVQLAWNPSSGASAYSVYYGVGSGQYTNRTVIGSGTNATITLPARGIAFYFAVTAVGATGLESGFSNEITYTAPSPPAPPTQRPLTIITVLKSSTPSGVFADAGMNWSDVPDQPQAYYKLRIDKGIALSTSQPPMPR